MIVANAKVIELAEEIVILEELIDLELWAKEGNGLFVRRRRASVGSSVHPRKSRKEERLPRSPTKLSPSKMVKEGYFRITISIRQTNGCVIATLDASREYTVLVGLKFWRGTARESQIAEPSIT
jgi:hypothetical protein